jgi:hypothetical protein
MTTTELTSPLRAPSSLEPWRDARRDALPATPAVPTVGEIVEETLPLIDFVPQAGPPIVFVAAPWLLLSLMLIGPFALLVTLVVVLVAAAAIIALAAAVLASPYLVVRRVRAYRAAHATVPAPVGRLAPLGAQR